MALIGPFADGAFLQRDGDLLRDCVRELLADLQHEAALLQWIGAHVETGEPQ